MARLKLNAQVREDRGTRRSKRLRAQGVIPAVLYGGDQESIPLGIDNKELLKVLRSKGGEHAIVDLQVSGGALEQPLKKTVIVKEVQHDHIRDGILHVDFAAISLTEKLVVKVPIVDSGDPVGVAQGGVLEHIIRELEVECLPTDLPEHIAVDVSTMNIGSSIKVAEITAPPGVKILTDPNLTVFTVSLPKVEKVEVPAEEAAAAAAAPAEGEEQKPGEEKEQAKGKEKEQAKGKEKEEPRGKEKEKAKE
jgi:large subunit ribosomal protein L25